MVMRHPETSEMSVIIVDEFTGRLDDRPAVVATACTRRSRPSTREGVKIKEETQTLATITLQNFFKLYKKLAGMTGTAMTEANEFWKIYKLDVIAIPTNKPLHPRQPSRRRSIRTEKEKWDAIVEEIVEVTQRAAGRSWSARPDVEKSREAQRACSSAAASSTRCSTPSRSTPPARPRSSPRPAASARVTIATNMAGRGTDIILGGNPETHGLGPASRTSTPPASTCPRTTGSDRSTRSRPRRR